MCRKIWVKGRKFFYQILHGERAKIIFLAVKTAKNPTKTVTNKNAMNTKMTTKRRVNKTAKVAESTTNQSNNPQPNM